MNAWKASTGCVFPTGDPLDWKCYTSWLEMLTRMPYFAERNFVDTARWCYTSKNPPHGGARNGVAAHTSVGPITISNYKTIQFNPQWIVERARKDWRRRRVDGPGSGQLVLVTHGTASAIRYVWGWSAVAHVDIDVSLQRVLRRLEDRPVFYMRKVYDMAYIYPRPGSVGYYIGTSTINQKEPKSRSLDGVVEAFRHKVSERSEGLVTVSEHFRQLREGWRPVPDPEAPWVARRGSRELVCRPMAGNGVRHFPALLEAVLEAVG